MSAVIRSAGNGRVDQRKLLWVAPLAGLAAAAGNLAVYGLARAGLSLPLNMPALGPLAAGPLGAAQVVFASVAPALAAGGFLWLLARFTTQPVRVFQIVAGVLLVLSLAGPIRQPVDLATRLVLLVMHLVAGLVITGVLSAMATERKSNW